MSIVLKLDDIQAHVLDQVLRRRMIELPVTESDPLDPESHYWFELASIKTQLNREVARENR